MEDESKQLLAFENIRKVWHNSEWHFSVVDVIKVLVECKNANDYWYQLKKRESEQGVELSTICRQLKLASKDGKMYVTDCADTETMLRIIQSIPSRKAEPFKLWLAEVGYERLKENKNPSLIIDRYRKTYLKRGYSEEWIGQRIRSHLTRTDLTGEWDKRQIVEGWQYGALSNGIYRGTFGVDTKKYMNIKHLPKKENLRDHMNGLELSLTSLAEAVTTKVTQNKDAQGFKQCKDAVTAGTSVARRAKDDTEKTLQQPVISTHNYLTTPEKLNPAEQRRLIPIS